MSMKKISELQLETTANYQPLSKLNVRFWNQDLNTAELRFLITRDNFPLSLSTENVKVIIVLEQGNNFISSEDLEISSEVDGVASFLIPSDFMSAVSGEVTGQVYVGTLDSDEVVVQRKFTFQVENDLLSSIPSELKLQYIKTFSDLRQDVQDRITALENEFVVMEDYVVAVNQATTDGLNALNNLVNAKTVEYNNNHADKLALINNTVDGYVQDFLDQRSYIDTKYAEFQTAVGESGVVTDANAESWQKYKLTMDNGNYPITPVEDLAALQALAPGYYYTTGTPSPSGMSTSGFTHVEFRDTLDVKRITFRPYNTNQEAVMTYYRTTGWTGWENKFDGLEKSIDAQSKANVAENNAKAYADEKISELRKVLFTGSVNGVGNNVVLGDDYNNFDEIVLFYSTLGGRDSKVVKAKETNQIVIYSFNLTNSDGGNGDILETVIDRVNGTTLKISNEVRFNLLSQTGGSTSGITITEIIGVKY